MQIRPAFSVCPHRSIYRLFHSSRILPQTSRTKLKHSSKFRNFHTSLVAHRKVVHTFKLADIGEGITECEVIKWSVGPSSQVATFDPLCEVQSDKASVEITSPWDGTLKEILVQEGEVAKVGQGLCLVEVEEEGDEPPSASEAEPAPEAKEEPKQQEPSPSTPKSERRKHPMDPTFTPSSSAPSKARSSNVDILATPATRHYAASQGVDLADVAPGSGKNGRVEKIDVERYLQGETRLQPTSAPQPVDVRSEGGIDFSRDNVVEIGRTRYGMWKAMEKATQTPHFGYSTSLDITALHYLLPSLNANIPSHFSLNASSSSTSKMVSPTTLFPVPPSSSALDIREGREQAPYAKLTYLPWLIKCLGRAMMEWPLFRSSISSSSPPKPTLTIHPHANVALAISTPSGLYTPLLRGVDELSVYGIGGRVSWLGEKGRKSSTAPFSTADLPSPGKEVASITVSNIGSVGRGTAAFPLLGPGGGVAIVAVGRAEWAMVYQEPLSSADALSDEEYGWISGLEGSVGRHGVKRGQPKGRLRLKLPISFTADHRVLEGAELAAFVETWRSWVEHPGRVVGAGL